MSAGAKGKYRNRPVEAEAQEARSHGVGGARGTPAENDGDAKAKGEAGASTSVTRPAQPELTGYELQDTMTEALGDVVRAELGALEPGPLLLMLKAHRLTDLRKFMADHYVPARRIDLVAAKRVLPYLQRAQHRALERDLHWLCGPLSNHLNYALLVAIGVAEAHDGPGLDTLVKDYGPTALRLVALSRWGSYHTESLLAALVVEGQLVPESWRPCLERLRPVAEGVVAKLRDELGERRAGRKQAGDEEAGYNDGADEEAELAGDGREAWAPGEGLEVTGGEIGREEARPADARAAAEQEALKALRRWQEAAQAFEATLARLRALREGALGRVTWLSCQAQVPDKEVDSLKALATQLAARPASGERDDELALVEDFASLCELAASGQDDASVYEAYNKVMSHPAAARFPQLAFAASRGRVTLGAPPNAPPALEPWLKRSPVSVTGAPQAAASPSSPKMAEARPISEATGHKGPVGGEDDESGYRAAGRVVTTSQEDDDGTSHEDEAGAGPGPTGQGGEAKAFPARPAATEGAGLAAVELEARVLPVAGASTEPEPAPGQHSEELAGLLAASEWSLAYWTAKASGEKARAEALRAFAYIDATRSATGPLALALPDLVGSLRPQALSGDRPFQLLALAAATRAALVAPYSGVSSVLDALATVFSADLPRLAELALKAQESARRGLLFAPGGGAAWVDKEAVRALQEEAATLLSRPVSTNTVRGSRIWRAWSQVGGVIWELLDPVRSGHTSAAPALAARVSKLSRDTALLEEIQKADMEHRKGPTKLEPWCRQVLLNRLREALRVARAWAELSEPAHSQAEDPSVVAQRQLFTAARGQAERALEALAASGDALLAGAAQGALRTYQGTFELMAGRPLPGPEARPEDLLTRDLARSDLALGPDGAPMPGEAPDVGAISVAMQRSWPEAFEAREARGDHHLSALALSIMAERGLPTGALATRREAALAEGREQVRAMVFELLGRLEAARRSGLVDEAEAATIEGRLRLASDPARCDLGAARQELAEVEASFAWFADMAVAEFRTRLEASASKHPAVAEARSRFEGLLSAKDLATGEELLLQLEQGIAQPRAYTPEVRFEEFFPSVPEALSAGATPGLVEAAKSRSRFGPLDFSQLSPDAALARADALQSWLVLSQGERTATKAPLLAPVLRVLGLEFKGERNAAVPASNERSWLDLTGVSRVPQTLVPAFGSAAGSEQRLLLVWKQPGEAVLDWVEQDRSGRAVIVLYFGTLGPKARAKVANRLRRRRATQPVVIVDDAVVAWAASLGQATFEVTMRATLPFSAVNPYEPGVAGEVPVEMFYGREAEVAEIARDRGTCLVYGGRRLGKSALLRAAQRHFNATAGHRALYIDLANKGVIKPVAVWDLVHIALMEANLAERPNPRRAAPDPFESSARAVRDWLEGSASRKLLLLLDECDTFFDHDAEEGFTQTRRLKDLMESTDRRFKVVFAGLHQVARFSSYPNQPLAHLGRPLAIGPLAPQPAYRLVVKPFTALGWRFASEDLVARALAYTNYTPILLQEFGQALLEHLYDTRPLGPGEPPSFVTAADIEQVLSSGRLAEAIRTRFHLTLALDPRYRAIAYVMALRAWEGRGTGPVGRPETPRALFDECREWWPAAFSSLSVEEFRALLEELSGLGVLSRDASGSWQVRSPNVLRLLGNQEEIEDHLVGLVSEDTPAGGLAAAEGRRLLPGGRRSPFSERLLADLIGEGHNQLRVVLGTDALAARLAPDALAAANELTLRWELVRPNRPAVFNRAVYDMARKGHRVVFIDLRHAHGQAVVEAVSACTKAPDLPGATRSVIILASPEALSNAEWAISTTGVADAAVVPLRRYSQLALRVWALEAESGFTSDEAQARAMEVTGGWPVLVQEVEESARSQSARRALLATEQALQDSPSRLLDLAGIGKGILAEAYQVAATLLGEQGKEDLETLGALLRDSAPSPSTGAPSATGEDLVRALVAAGVLDESADGKVGTERVVYRAWSAVATAATPLARGVATGEANAGEGPPQRGGL